MHALSLVGPKTHHLYTLFGKHCHTNSHDGLLKSTATSAGRTSKMPEGWSATFRVQDLVFLLFYSFFDFFISFFIFHR